ncbi:MAG: AraC family transcriptional regulator [Caulobacter sp.]
MSRHADLPRHRHAEPYLAVVLAGGYEEAGDGGRRQVRAGEAVLHYAFEAHLDRLSPQGAEVLNLPLPHELSLPAFLGLDDVDAIARLAERDVRAASELAVLALRPLTDCAGDWPDALAAALNDDPSLEIATWAGRQGLAPETVSRGFRQVFGVSPKRFRLEARARRAWRGLAHASTLASLAADTGFADQAHMTRAVTQLTGRTPGAWIKSVQYA